MATAGKIPITHPGDILRTEFLEQFGMSQSELARQLRVDKRRVVTASTAVSLARFFDITPDFWLNMEKRYELDMAEEEAEQARREITPLRAA